MTGLHTPARLLQVQGELAQTMRLLGAPGPLLKAFAVTGLAEIDRIFRVQGDPPWKPLASSTQSARRQGVRGGGRGPLALSGLRASFDAQIDRHQVIIFSNRPEAIFHEFGTRGPYTIRPKHAKALALPFLPGRDAGSGTSGQGKAGKFSLAGLQGGKPTGRGSFTGTPARGSKAAVPYTNIAFFMSVTHPGLVPRRMLPTEDQILPKLQRVAMAFLDRTLRPATKSA